MAPRLVNYVTAASLDTHGWPAPWVPLRLCDRILAGHSVTILPQEKQDRKTRQTRPLNYLDGTARFDCTMEGTNHELREAIAAAMEKADEHTKIDLDSWLERQLESDGKQTRSEAEDSWVQKLLQEHRRAKKQAAAAAAAVEAP